MVADALPPHVTRSSVAMVLAMWNQAVFVSQQPMKSQCSEMIENADIYYMFAWNKLACKWLNIRNDMILTSLIEI